MKQNIKKSILISTTMLLTTSCAGKAYTKTVENLKMTSSTIALLDAFEPYIIENSKNYLIEENFINYKDYLNNRSGDPQEINLDDFDLSNSISKSTVKGESVYTIKKDDSYDSIVLYVHGGAYVGEVSYLHVNFSDKLASKLNAKVCLPLYPLAPQHTFEAVYEMIDEVYNQLLTENKPIYIMGDSAGGGFTLAYTEYLKANNRKLPNKLVMLSPWVDVTMENEEIRVYEQCDISLAPYGAIECGKMYAGNTDRKDYRISPVYGDLSNLPDMLIFVGNHEIVYPDDMKLFNGLKDTNVNLVVGEGFWHVFPLFEIEEQAYCLDKIASFVK